MAFEFEFIYYFIQKRNNLHSSAHIGRVCPNSLDGSLDSYTELELQCGTGVESFSVLKAAEIGIAGFNSSVVYAVFTDSSFTTSALCLYDMTDIERNFTDAIDKCIKGTGEPNEFLRDSECGQVSIIIPLHVTSLYTCVLCRKSY